MSIPSSSSFSAPSQRECFDSLFLQGLTKLVEFPPDNLWMLAVDGRFFKKVREYEEREDGCVVAILNGIAKGILKIRQGITVELIKEIHKCCLEPIKNKTKLMEPGVFRNSSSKVLIGIGCATVEGIEALYDDANPIGGFNGLGNEKMMICDIGLLPPVKLYKDPATGRPAGEFDDSEEAKEKIWLSNPKEIKSLHLEKLKQAARNGWAFFYYPPNPFTTTDLKFLELYFKSQIQEKVIDNYKTKLPKAANLNQKIIEIADFAKRGIQSHSFRDGTNRLYFNCFVNVLMITQGEDVTILEEPNIFECFSLPQLSEKIQQGTEITKKIKKNPDAEVYGFSNKQLSEDLKAKFKAAAMGVIISAQVMIKKIQSELKPNLQQGSSEEVKTISSSPSIPTNNTANKGDDQLLNALKPFLMKKAANTNEQTIKAKFLQEIKTEKYSLALRTACAYGLIEEAKIILNNFKSLNFDINEKSKNHHTALDWLEQAKIGVTAKESLKKQLLLNGAKTGF